MVSAVNNSVVLNFVNRVEHKAWEGIEKCANKNSTASRFFAVAVVIERVARAIFLGAACFIEQIVLTVISLKDYLCTSDQEQKKVHLNACKQHAVGILLTGFIGIPAAMIMNLISAGVDAARVIKNPLSAAKHQIAMLDRAAYKESASKENKLFVDAAYDRFMNALNACNTNEELSAVHFMDTEESKAKLIAECNAKKAVLLRAFEVITEQEQTPDNIAQMKKFVQDLIKAEPADVEGMKFNPTVANPETAAATA